MDEPVRVYRRRLPHWRMGGAVYFVTWRLDRNASALTVAERDQIAHIVRHGDGERFRLFAYVVMDDHVHVVVHPAGALEKVVHGWKSYSTWMLQRGGRQGVVWQAEYYDRILRDDRELEQKVEYVLANPERRWPGVTSYPWAWSRFGNAR